MLSFAQNFEDVMIARLFPVGHQGFYIDVGAADPVYLSVTKHFYDQGWQGVNVEPLPAFFERIQAARPRDANVNAVIGKVQGRKSFFEIQDLPENSTSDEQVMVKLQGEGRTVKSHEVEVFTLAQICEMHAANREIDFMKIDVEGGELEVLESGDWYRFRPVLLVIEAVAVNGREETWAQWEHVLTEHHYRRVWFDGLNNFYLREESLHLREHFMLPPNVFDQIQLPRVDVGSADDPYETIRRIDEDRYAKQEVVNRLIVDLASANADRVAKQEVVDRLIVDLASANADRVAKQEVVDRLIVDLTTANADREIKQQLIDRLTARVNELEARG